MVHKSTGPDSNQPYNAPKRYVTTHDADGKAIFSQTLPEIIPTHEIPGMLYNEAYTTFQSPANLTSEDDINAMVANTPNESSPGFPQPGNTILRYCDWPPGGSSPIHRHETIDYGIVIFGAMEAIMDSGETRVLHQGDLIVQRNTLHAWRNPSDTQWARMIFVINGCLPTRISGKEMTQSLDAFGK